MGWDAHCTLSDGTRSKPCGRVQYGRLVSIGASGCGVDASLVRYVGWCVGHVYGMLRYSDDRGAVV